MGTRITGASKLGVGGESLFALVLFVHYKDCAKGWLLKQEFDFIVLFFILYLFDFIVLLFYPFMPYNIYPSGGFMNQHTPAKWPKISPWIIVAAIVGAVALAGIMFNRDYRRERGYLEEMFLQRGEILIHSMEMVGRVRYGQEWEEAQLLAFWNNLEADSNVLFLALTDDEGRLPVVVGDLTPPSEVFLKPNYTNPGDGGSRPVAAHLPGFMGVPAYRMEKIDGRLVFMAFRPFQPWSRQRMMGKDMRHSLPSGAEGEPQGWRDHQGHNGGNQWDGHKTKGMNRSHMGPSHDSKGSDGPTRYLWVGFDMGPFEKISHKRIRTAAVFIILLSLTLLAGVLALIWGHNSRLARRMYRDTNALAAELIGRLPVGVVIKDRKGLVSLVNQSTLAISGLEEKDFLGRDLAEITQGTFPPDEILAGREMTISFSGGATKQLALTSGPVSGDDGEKLGQVILMEDLGEVGRLKAELAQKERLATLGSLAAGLAHEIRNPLGAIRGLSQHLLNKGPADPGDREALEVVLTSVDRLNSTITNFLDYARPVEVKTQSLDLGQLVRKMAALAGHDAQSQAVDLVLDLPEEPLIIQGDEALLSQAFLNLYLNAIQAAGERAGGGGRLTVSLRANEQRAVLLFRDNGPGFNSEQLDQPFVPYFTTKADGTGLGLAMVEKTIRAHPGADIALGVPASGGGLVTITFPR